MSDRIYLDNATAARPSKGAIVAMMPFFETSFGAVGAPHEMSRELLAPMQAALASIAALFHAKENDHFVFTASGAEAVNQVIHTAYFEIAKRTGKNHCITSCVDEAPGVLALQALEEEGVEVTMVPISKSGVVEYKTLVEAITPRTALISITLASGLTGVIQPFSEIAKLCKERAIALHIDVTHAVGKLKMDIEELGATFITFNGEQFHAPRGTGGIFSRGIKPTPFIYGAPLNTALLAATGQAALEAEQDTNLYCTEVARMKSLFEEKVIEGYPEAVILFQDAERLPHITTLSFPGLHHELLLFHLNRKNLFATIGGGVFQSLEAILQQAGFDPIVAQGAISFALSKETQEKEVVRAAQIIIDAAKKMRRLTKTLV